LARVGEEQIKKNKSPAVLESILKSLEVMQSEDVEPTFNAVLTHLASRNILSNHRSLRVYLDTLVQSGMLKLRTEPTKQPNVRAKQVYSLTGRSPSIEVGEKALLFHGLNWSVPSMSSIRARTDLQGLARTRLARGTLYGSIEDTVSELLAKTKNTSRVHQTLVFCAALLATKKFDAQYLMRRAKERYVADIVESLLDEIDYLRFSPKPEVEDVRTLYEIRKQLTNRRQQWLNKSDRFRMSPNELIDVVGKQLGVK